MIEKRVLIGLTALGLCLGVRVMAAEPQLDTSDYTFKPLVDTQQTYTLQGQAQKQGTTPAKTTMLNAQVVKTLQQAMEDEKGDVNWYAWYMAARAYLARAGGLRCALGTPIRFYRNGSVEASTFDPVCLASVAGRHFPLPAKTKLDVLILPVRAGEAPPASPEELYSRVKSSGTR